jgi:hypothetical protein
MFIQIYSYLVSKLKSIMEVWEKNQNNKSGYGIEVFLEKKCSCFIFHQNSMFHSASFFSSQKVIIGLYFIQIQTMTKKCKLVSNS